MEEIFRRESTAAELRSFQYDRGAACPCQVLLLQSYNTVKYLQASLCHISTFFQATDELVEEQRLRAFRSFADDRADVDWPQGLVRVTPCLTFVPCKSDYFH